MQSLFTITSLLLLAFSGVSHGQVCQIVDDQQVGIPYVNVYFSDLGTGFVSDAEGFLYLPAKLKAAADDAQATLSCIGFEDYSISLAELRAGSSACPLVLTKVAYPLAQAEVTARSWSGKSKTLGFRKDESNVVSSYFPDTAGEALGAEIGNHMRVRGPWRLRSIGTNLAVDSASIFELNVYQYDKGKAGERLHRQRLFLAVPARSTTDPVHILDVSEANIQGSDDFMVSIEVIGAPVSKTAANPALDTSILEDYLPLFNSKIALRGKQRITRYREQSGKWRKLPLGIVAGIWADVEQ